ncbi:hypothetical protein QO002_005417 [Pararhizobium capsulatum DSM 1112]|uniref:Uncharacterized protein n=1 Tax=Pararhizobium capsulatum DSM 1112 TaxID=1121113 RepID=A0ABU0BZW7_9HYPH|nr:hypothetical protein [Pararhizobium capsulatum]MDQ0323211.1 hypothetical protein [Pararhizobium capsulatum DSM 1112]
MPRHDSYRAFQQAPSDRINEGLLAKQPSPGVINDLNRLFVELQNTVTAGGGAGYQREEMI